MSLVGQADAAIEANAPGTDGNGTGVPQNSVIQNWTAMANAVAADVAGTWRAVDNPNQPYTLPAQGTAGSVAGNLFGGVSLFTLIVIGIVVYAVFKVAEAEE